MLKLAALAALLVAGAGIGVAELVGGRAAVPDASKAPPDITPDGEAVARDPGWGLTLWRLDGPLVSVPTEITGLYPGDSWSGPTVTWERGRCRGGMLSVGTFSDPALFDAPQTITVRVGGRIAGRVRLNPTGNERLTVPLRPEGGACRVVFRVSPTAVPAEVTNGENPDERELGVHFYDFRYSR